MRKASFLIGACLMLALTFNVLAYQRSHPEIMQEIAQTRPQLQENIEAGNAAAAAEISSRLEGLFRETIPIYESMNLTGAIERANKVAAAAAEAAAASKANNLAAAATAHENIQKACGGCHSQFREKAPDGSWRFKAQ